MVTDTQWKIVGTSDFNADGRTDLLWQHDQGWVAIWFMDGERQIAGSLGHGKSRCRIGGGGSSPPAMSTATGCRIFCGSTPTVACCLVMDGWRYLGRRDRLSERCELASCWRADVNGDRRLDLVWHHAVRGDVAVWFMADKVLLDGVQVNSSTDTNWHIVAVSDLDRDGAPDLIWQNVSTGELAAWMLDGALVRFGVLLNPAVVPDTNWKIVGPR